ncbi:S-layer homology domain-containing protein [Intestinibacillus massiliensis]|nr:S-layer homology domain-containing protein [Intestinibacillus massiliensis]
MKNLKKVLALVMAFAMAFTMMAGAAFTDQADIKATEAVDMLTALNIINGNPDGSFNPEGTVTRAEMAKMIYVLRTGKDTADNFTSTPTTFTDINGHWAAGFIKYCQTMGIIAGESATKFNPDGIVTGTQAAKMLLVTIGYDQNKAGLVGSGWDTKTNALASENGLLDDVDSDLNSGLPRQYAAQLIYNAVDADTVSYDDAGNVQKTEKTENNIVEKETGEVIYKYTILRHDGSEAKTVEGLVFDSYAEASAYVKDAANNLGASNSGAGTVVTGKPTANGQCQIVKDNGTKVLTFVTQTETKNETVGEKYLSLKTSVGTLMASGNATLDDTNYSGSDNGLKISIKDNDFDSGSKNVFTKVTTDYSNLLGTRVKVLYKDTDKVYGVYATDDNYVNVTVKASDLDTVSGNTNKIDVDGTKYTVDSNAVVYVNNEKSVATDTVKKLVDNYGKSDFDVTLISNDENDKIDVIRVTVKKFAKISSLSSSTIYYKEYVAGDAVGATVKVDVDDDPVVYDDMAKDDYVFVSNTNGVSAFKDAVIFEKATKVTGKSSSTKSDSIQMDGTWYNIENAKNSGETNNWKIDRSYDMYVYGTYAYLVEGSSGSNLDVLLVKSIGDVKTLDSGVEAKVLFDDGTEKVINVTKLITSANGTEETADKTFGADGSDLKSALKSMIGSGATLVQYSEDGGDYVLKQLAADTSKSNHLSDIDGADTKYGVKTGAAYNEKQGTLGSYDISNDAVVYVQYKVGSDTKYKVVNGKSFLSYKDSGVASTGIALYDTSDKDYAKVGLVVYSTNISSGDTQYAMVKGVSYKNNDDGDKVAVFDLLTSDGLKEGVVSDDNYTNSNIVTKGKVITYSGSVDSEITSVENAGGKYGAAKADFTNNRLTFNTGLYVDGNGAAALSGGAKVTGDTVKIFVDQSGSWTSMGDGSASAANEIYKDGVQVGYYANVYAVVNADDEFDLLIVATNNELEDKNGRVELLGDSRTVSLETAATGLEAYKAETTGKAGSFTTANIADGKTVSVEKITKHGETTDLAADFAGTSAAAVASNKVALTVKTANTVKAGSYDVTVKIDSMEYTVENAIVVGKLVVTTGLSVTNPGTSEVTEVKVTGFSALNIPDAELTGATVKVTGATAGEKTATGVALSGNTLTITIPATTFTTEKVTVTISDTANVDFSGATIEVTVS